MQAITIGTEHGAQEILHRLDEELRCLQDEGIDVQIDLHAKGKYTFLDCKVHPATPQAEALVRHYVASALSDVIVEQWERDLLKKIVRGQYYYFSRDEQERIMEHAGRNLQGEGGRANHYKLSRKARILHRLRDFLDHHHELVLEGFLHFRLRDYLEELEDAVDRAVDDFLMEREQGEFIRLLRYFVEAQEPRVDEVHVVIRPEGSFALLDASGGAIQASELADLAVERFEGRVDQEDLLISALITLAPRRLTLHGHGTPCWQDGVETVTGVFGDRVTLCPGCHLCPAASGAVDALKPS